MLSKAIGVAAALAGVGLAGTVFAQGPGVGSCATGNFAPWQMQVGAIDNDDGSSRQRGQKGYSLLAQASAAAGRGELKDCEDTLAALNSVIGGSLIARSAPVAPQVGEAR